MNDLIDTKSREENELMVKKALAISESDALEPTEETLALVEEYIEGNMTIEEIQKIVIDKYKERKDD